MSNKQLVTHRFTRTEDLQISQVFYLINTFFKNRQKSAEWMLIANPLLGGITPLQMIAVGRTDKLLDFISCSLEGNFP